MRRGFGTLTWASAVLIVGLVTGCGADEPTTSIGPAVHVQRGCPHSHRFLYSGITPAKLDRDPESISGAPMIYSAWTAGTRWRYTLLSSQDGRFVINRDRACRSPSYGRNHRDEVLVPGAGPLEITRAPIGPDVVRWAQRRGEFEFTSESGVTGTLHLQDESVTFDDEQGDVSQSCPSIRGFSEDPENALSIEVRGASCAEAEQFIRSVHGTCKLGECQLDGFTCEGVDELTQAVIVECTNGSRRLRWTWSIGY